ncbi:MAG: class II fumarate hydratase [Candidatus Bathyarchaeia archaeon]
MVEAIKGTFRIERDSMGEMRVPAQARYGAQTQRAVQNFPISDLRFSTSFIRALAIIKLAAAKANMQLGLLDSERGKAIVSGCEEVVDGKWDTEFVVDVFQTGSGTSTNMNANEVIANRATEILGKTDKKIHPNDHVNMCQSTNDAFPTAMHVAALEQIEKKLIPALKTLHQSLDQKADEFKDIVKSGRTHLQDAVPITLGQEFSGYASMIEHGIRRVESVRGALSELALGGTALGTGLNAPPDFANIAIEEISRVTGVRFTPAENRFEAMGARDAGVETSGALKTIAVSLMKIANDLRLLTSGPRTGFDEIELPATQPGSSIMPGKVNPVIPESVNMVAARIFGCDTTITICGQAGQLDLNTMMPIMAHELLLAIEIIANASKNLAEQCISGISARKEKCMDYAEKSLALVTVVAPTIGYDNTAKIAKKALAENKPVRQAIREEKIVDEKKLKEILDLKKITRGGRI